MVLVQFTQFRADTGNVLIHLASEIGKALIHLRAQAANSLEYNNRKNSNILEMFIKMMIDSKAGLFHKPKSIQKKQPPATPIYISRVYLQIFMGFGFLAFMPGQWVWETPLCSGVDLSHESQDNYTIFASDWIDRRVRCISSLTTSNRIRLSLTDTPPAHRTALSVQAV